MSTRTLLTAVFIALALGLVVLLVVNRQRAPQSDGLVPAGERLLELDTAKVTSILIAPPGPASAATVVERDAGGQWSLSIGSIGSIGSGAVANTGGKVSWRVDPTRVRNLLAILASIQAVSKPEPGAKVGDAPTVVTLSQEGGGEIVLRMSARILGGQGLVEVTCPPGNVPRPLAGGAGASLPPAAGGGTGAGAAGGVVTRLALTSNQLHNLFQSEAVRTWRDPALLPGVLTEASRVRLIGDKGSLALAKVNGRWGMTEPLAVAADAAAVQKLLTTLEGVRIQRFFDERIADASKAGLDAPKARVLIESDRRTIGADGAASVSTVKRDLVIGDSVDPGGKVLYATIDGGTTLVGIDAGPLAEIDIEPTRFISRVSSGAASADIGLLMFVATPPAPPAPAGAGGAASGAPGPGASQPAGPEPAPRSMGFLRRTDSATGGWLELRPDGSQVAQEPKRVQAINDLLKTLTSEACSTVLLSEPTGYQALGTLSLRTVGDQPIDDLEIGRFAGAGVAVKSGRVCRTYAAIPELFAAVLGPIEPPPVKDGGPETRDINK